MVGLGKHVHDRELFEPAAGGAHDLQVAGMGGRVAGDGNAVDGRASCRERV